MEGKVLPNIKECANARDGRLFHVSKEMEALVVEELFANASSQIDILFRNINTSVFNTNVFNTNIENTYIKKDKFFSNPKVRIRFLIENQEKLKPGFVNNFLKNTSVDIRKYPKHLNRRLSVEDDNRYFHEEFIVVDKSSYWYFEEISVGSFGSFKMAESLTEKFDALWDKSKAFL